MDILIYIMISHVPNIVILITFVKYVCIIVIILYAIIMTFTKSFCFHYTVYLFSNSLDILHILYILYKIQGQNETKKTTYKRLL